MGEHQNENSRRWYAKNRERVIKATAIRKARLRKEWVAFKAKQICTHCGAKHVAIIDFHHVIRTNKRSVNKLASTLSNVKEAIKEATEKCIPLCSNCHRILHWKEHRARQRKQQKK